MNQIYSTQSQGRPWKEPQENKCSESLGSHLGTTRAKKPRSQEAKTTTASWPSWSSLENLKRYFSRIHKNNTWILRVNTLSFRHAIHPYKEWMSSVRLNISKLHHRPNCHIVFNCLQMSQVIRSDVTRHTFKIWSKLPTLAHSHRMSNTHLHGTQMPSNDQWWPKKMRRTCANAGSFWVALTIPLVVVSAVLAGKGNCKAKRDGNHSGAGVNRTRRFMNRHDSSVALTACTSNRTFQVCLEQRECASIAMCTLLLRQCLVWPRNILACLLQERSFSLVSH